MNIQEFSFGNFKSFKDINTLNLGAAKIKSIPKELDNNNLIKNDTSDDLSFLKSKAIYGANASGKSNVIKALRTFLRIIKDSVKNEDVLMSIDNHKLSTTTETEPAFFQIIFWLEGVRYRYGFESSNNKVLSEWLYGKAKVRELAYFIREGNEIVKMDKKNFSEGSFLEMLTTKESNNDFFRDNSLFLSSLGAFGFGKLSKKIIDSLNSIIIINGLGDYEMMDLAKEFIKKEEGQKYLVEFLKHGDIGINNVEDYEVKLEDIPAVDESIVDSLFGNKKKKNFLISERDKYDEDLKKVGREIFSFEGQESEGTQKLFELSPFIYEALKFEKTIIIDEFDARFHPLITKKIVELFNSEENNGAQLIFTTHDTNLLSSNLLRRDQVDFVEKDKYGASHLYSLVQFKGIRNNASFEKDYIQGKYGAIPYLGDFGSLIFKEEENAQKD